MLSLLVTVPYSAVAHKCAGLLGSNPPLFEQGNNPNRHCTLVALTCQFPLLSMQMLENQQLDADEQQMINWMKMRS